MREGGGIQVRGARVRQGLRFQTQRGALVGKASPFVTKLLQFCYQKFSDSWYNNYSLEWLGFWFVEDERCCK